MILRPFFSKSAKQVFVAAALSCMIKHGLRKHSGRSFVGFLDDCHSMTLLCIPRLQARSPLSAPQLAMKE